MTARRPWYRSSTLLIFAGLAPASFGNGLASVVLAKWERVFGTEV